MCIRDSYVILNNFLNQFGGDTAISVMGIINSVNMLILMPIFGINQGAQPIIGYNFGAQQFDRVKETVKTASLSATGVVILGFIFLMAFPQQFIMLFNKTDLELISLSLIHIFSASPIPFFLSPGRSGLSGGGSCFIPIKP